MKLKIKILILLCFVGTIISGFATNDYISYRQVKKYLDTNLQDQVKVTVSPRLQKAIKELRYPHRFKKPEDISKIIIINLAGGLGDYFASLRIQKAAENLGWESVIIAWANQSVDINKRIIDFIQPEFVISQYPVGVVKDIPNYLIVHSEPVVPKDFFSSNNSYDGFLLSSGDANFVKEISAEFNDHGKPFTYEYFYFSIPENYSQFRELDYSKLYYSGDRWDKLRGGEKFTSFFNLLDQTGYFNVYGPEKIWNKYVSYKGFLPYDDEIFLEAIRSSGIALVIHSNSHFANNLPSAKIFEALASSAMIISDKLKFVQDNFGDNVLYIDPSLPAEELFKQVDGHVKWIHEHPKEAAEKAKNANRIFREKFLLERILQNVEKMHNKIHSVKP